MINTTNINTLDPVALWHLNWCLDNTQYEERPVDIKTFIESASYMNSSKECWETVKEDLSGLFIGYDNPSLAWKYNEAVFDEGIGSGKSYKASLIITYLIYRTLILKNPQEFFNLAKDSSIYFINMSSVARCAINCRFI